MRLTICVAAVVLTCGAPTAAFAAPHSGFQINETSWSYVTEKGVKAVESIDASGNYVVNSAAGKHMDHGTSVMKGDKVCFTSLMTKDGESCWTTKTIKVGQSTTTVNDKGRKLHITRLAYKPLDMPK